MSRARRIPCEECPWRKDTPPGQFPAERYDALRATTGTPGREAPYGAGVFSCHKSSEGTPIACAGWLGSPGGGYLNLTARVMAARGVFDWPAVDESWPELFETYDEMAEAQGG